MEKNKHQTMNENNTIQKQYYPTNQIKTYLPIIKITIRAEQNKISENKRNIIYE